MDNFLKCQQTVTVFHTYVIHLDNNLKRLSSHVTLYVAFVYFYVLMVELYRFVRVVGTRVGWFWTFLHFQQITPEICYIPSKCTINRKKIWQSDRFIISHNMDFMGIKRRRILQRFQTWKLTLVTKCILKKLFQKKEFLYYTGGPLCSSVQARGGRFLDFLDFQPAATGGWCKMLF
jgi:hypothetical protein